MSESKTLFDCSDGSREEAITSEIVFDHNLDRSFSYIVPEELGEIKPGQRVKAPFGKGNKKLNGFCISSEKTSNTKGLKRLSKIIDSSPLLTPELLELANWLSLYYVCPLGQVLSAMLPAGVKKGQGFVQKRFIKLNCSNIHEARKIYEKLREGSKQKSLVRILIIEHAFVASGGIESSELVKQAETTSQTLKNLINTGAAVSEKRAVLKSVQEQTVVEEPDITLNSSQEKSIEQINQKIDESAFGVFVLHGVTGSGKTEVYIRALANAVEQGKKGIILLPEIALTSQTILRFQKRFKRLAVLHSGLTEAQRASQWHKIKLGRADVIIGARSAVFAPCSNLGVVIVDEEHESSYKQDTAPRYNARDTAVKRAQIENAACILGSATPSFESYFNCKRKEHFKLLNLPERVEKRPMPQMQEVDMSGRRSFMSEFMIGEKLKEALESSLGSGEQAILLLNRRGYSNFIYCPECGHTIHCRNCDASLKFHLSEVLNQNSTEGLYNTSGLALCHYCGSRTLVPKRCPICTRQLTMRGSGSQKLQMELADKFPKAKIARIDTDSMKGKDYRELIEAFSKHEYDILAGTQMLAKGLHFPNVTLVGIVNADTSTSSSDFRSAEKTFQLISQVAGRTGRGSKPGKVIIQTAKPDSPAVKFAKLHDYDGFYKNQIPMREMLGLPPFRKQALVQVRNEKKTRAEEDAEEAAEILSSIIKTNGIDIRLKGPFEPAIGRIGREFRMNILLNAASPFVMMSFLTKARFSEIRRVRSKLFFDIDPLF
ncbi:Primosomal protein N' [Sedimentisphaera cyanobacteriorum]|uniref:Replication restart protein PriA n=1 Tax=Sedimentisphaera cyanobacteriorum TaxID=1940790 RepID=A0A1Q2HSR4_9BACT|nr:primosomal protein N' [Sedimentisphaera cyanobacteriorum]AQQ10371.1 Primosomal protein N' [Sedimentisphaera cyanobacteriorum]